MVFDDPTELLEPPSRDVFFYLRHDGVRRVLCGVLCERALLIMRQGRVFLVNDGGGGGLFRHVVASFDMVNPKDHLTLQWKGLNLYSRGWVLKMTPGL